ncbi:23720_t:CDS:2 [Gigaspora margarita]|uniref:23720_t:CDS:1 n=1 Tax=Gigaspora margarita TaxID=4874 RepID=A0ABN7UP03_GIGMA|nr:23720_t:CDS:2 [Gigaspora margarita]
MPCYADTIIKIKHVKRKEKDAKVPSVWALGTYPLERDDNEIEVALFLLVNPQDRNLESQTIFRKDEYYSAREIIIPGSYAGKLNQNKKKSCSTRNSDDE